MEAIPIPTTPPPANYLQMLNFLFDIEEMHENEANPKAIRAMLSIGFEVYGRDELLQYAKRIDKFELLNGIIKGAI